VNSLPETVIRQCHYCDLNPGPSVPDQVQHANHSATEPHWCIVAKWLNESIFGVRITTGDSCFVLDVSWSRSARSQPSEWLMSSFLSWSLVPRELNVAWVEV